MRKIIGFKLPLRLKETQRRAKKAKIETPEEAELQGLLDKATEKLKPAVLFDTYQPDEDQKVLSPMPGLAYSVVLATLGPAFDAFCSEWGKLGEVVREQAVEEGVRFATGLLAEEAARDACELSPLNPLSEAGALETALKKLDGAKIGVSLAEGKLVPTASAACSLSWLAKSRAKGKAK